MRTELYWFWNSTTFWFLSWSGFVLFASQDGNLSRSTLLNTFFIGYVFMYNSSTSCFLRRALLSSVLFSYATSWSFDAFSNCYIQVSWRVFETEKSEEPRMTTTFSCSYIQHHFLAQLTLFDKSLFEYIGLWIHVPMKGKA